MAQYSDRMRARLEALSAKFADQLPEKLALIYDTYSAIFAGFSSDRPDAAGETKTLLALLRNELHKLAGTGATFGFAELSAAARYFEELLEPFIDSPQGPATADLTQAVRPSFDAAHTALLAAVRSYVREPGDHDEGVEPQLSQNSEEHTASKRDHAPQETSGAATQDLEDEHDYDDTGTLLPVGPESEPNGKDADSFVVYQLDDDPALIPDLEAQLGFFRMPVHKIGSVQELDFSAVTVGLGPEIKDKIILCDFALLDKMPGLEERLQQLTCRPGFGCVVVFISDRDDFAARLRAVRAGGTAFFSPPVDISVVIDRVDGLRGAGTNEPYHVLIIDDDQEQVSHTALILQQAGMITSVVSDPAQVVSVMIESRPELILMDLYMPGCDGIELTRIIRQQDSFVAVPIVFTSAENDREKQLLAIGSGADDFLVKPVKPEHLIKAVSLRAERTRSMRYFMERDSLTGLLNHSNLKGSLSLEMQRANRIGREMSFAMIDLDRFKRVNDIYGHYSGDRVLKSLARLLQQRLRKTDVIGRYGGEEFAVILFDVGTTQAKRLLDDIRESFSHIRHRAGEEEFSVTFSCGIAGFPVCSDALSIAEAADAALYRAKEAGRNQVVLAHCEAGA
ncbi:MAG: diguanylate cyclase [Spirochaetaceae bacterium]|nr:MAG: diguanylate cyclase [Spirochaetaceae bacterium]